MAYIISKVVIISKVERNKLTINRLKKELKKHVIVTNTTFTEKCIFIKSYIVLQKA